MYSVKVLADSVNERGDRLTTWELTYPRMVHAELLTHRLFSRNSASSRAIPIEKMIAQVENDPVLPVWWGKNQPGMQAREELGQQERFEAQEVWLTARDLAVTQAKLLHRVGVHKQIVNRLLEPWMWITVICSATEFGNWFNLRCDEQAQPEIKHLADMMAALYTAHCPRFVPPGEWHLPLVDVHLERAQAGVAVGDLRKISVGRCARVSYLTHDGRRDPQADIALCDRLALSGHWSPFEHVARAMDRAGDRDRETGNFTGWRQYRKDYPGEHRREWPGSG